MSCQEIRDKLSAYLDGVLDEKETDEIQSHIEHCPECRQEIEDLKKTIALLSSLEEIIPPASFRRELRHKLEQEAQTKGKTGNPQKAIINRFFAKARHSYLLPVAAALVFMVVSAPFILNMPKMGSEQKKSEMALDYEVRNSTGSPGFTADSVAPDAPSAAPSEEMLMKGKGDGEQGATSYRLQTTTSQEMTSKVVEEVERKIIKNASLSLEVEDYNSTSALIKEKITSLGGYIANESVNVVGTERLLRGNIEIRLPAVNFDSFLAGMEGLGKVNNRNIFTQDVTEEYVDVASRLKAMRTKEERLISILQKSGTLSDILAVENELANTRAQLESLEGRLRYLSNRVDFSSISINMRQVTASTQKITTGGFKDTIIKTKEAFILAINNILRDAGKLIIYIGSSLPYLILTAILAFGVWRFVKRRDM